MTNTFGVDERLYKVYWFGKWRCFSYCSRYHRRGEGKRNEVGKARPRRRQEEESERVVSTRTQSSYIFLQMEEGRGRPEAEGLGAYLSYPLLFALFELQSGASCCSSHTQQLCLLFTGCCVRDGTLPQAISVYDDDIACHLDMTRYFPYPVLSNTRNIPIPNEYCMMTAKLPP